MTRTKLILLAIFRLMALVGMLFSVCKPDIAVPGLIAAVVVYLGTYSAHYVSFITIPKAPHAHDRALFQMFLEALNPEKFLNGLGSTTLGATFRTDLITDTFRFVDTWRTDDKEFIDRKVQTAFAALYEEARAFANEVATLTVPWGEGGAMTTTKDIYKKWEISRRLTKKPGRARRSSTRTWKGTRPSCGSPANI